MTTMSDRSFAIKMAAVLGLAALALGASAQPASAGLFGPRTVIVMPGYPAYAIPAPVTTVLTAPVSTSTVITAPAPVVLPTPVADPGLVPTSYTTSTVVTTPVPTTYVAPAPIRAPARVRVVYPRRVYRYYGY
jgi:hypothetical protein